MSKKIKKEGLVLLGILLGNAILAFGIAGFILPTGIIMGGATGIGIAVNRFTGLDISLTVAILNLVLFVAGAFFLGKKFALTTIVSTLVYPMFLSFFSVNPWICNLTENQMLAAIYAGLTIGLGIGLVIRLGASTGGMDIPPLILNKKAGISVAVSMYVFDFAVLLLQVFTSTSEQVLYGILVVILSSLMLNYISLAGQKKVQVTVVSRYYQEIRDALLKELDLGATLYHIETGYLQKQEKAVLCVTSSRKLFHVNEVIQKIDPKAFITIAQIHEVRGRGFTLDRSYK